MGKTKDIANFDEYNGSWQEAIYLWQELRYSLAQIPYWTPDPDPETAEGEDFFTDMKEIIRDIKALMEKIDKWYPYFGPVMETKGSQ